MSPVVVVDVVPADVPAEQAQVMIDACSGAVPRGKCALASNSPENARPDAVALVLWRGPGMSLATVRVGRRNGEWVTRQLAFSDADPLHDRWIAAGLTVATLLDETRVATAATVGTETGPAVGTTPEGPLALADRAPRHFTVAAGALLGNGWDNGGVLSGPWVSGALSTPGRRFFALLGASYAVSQGPRSPSAGQLSSRWFGVEAGYGIQGWLAGVRCFAAPELALQWVSADLSSGGTLSDREVQFKVRGGLAWEASPSWALSFGGSARLLPVEGSTNDPERIRRSGFSGELLLGLEFSP